MKVVGWMGFLGAVGLTVGLAGPAHGQNQDPPGSAVVEGNAVSDAEITAAIIAKLDQMKMLQHAQVTVDTKNGEVTIVGTIPSLFARDKVMDVVNSTPGVLRTNDQLRVIYNSPEAPAHN